MCTYCSSLEKPLLSPEMRLLEDLLAQYPESRTKARPIADVTKPVDIMLLVVLQKVMRFREHEQVIELHLGRELVSHVCNFCNLLNYMIRLSGL